MKLVEILARELKEWPEHATMAVQDDDGQIKMAAGDEPINSNGEIWVRDVEVYHEIQHGPHNLATDHATAIVTREIWEAERAKLASNSEWNGDGLPPVGTYCEVEIYLDEWFKCTVVGYYEGRVVIVLANKKSAHIANPDQLRPIRTPEQIAAQERERVLDDIYRIIRTVDRPGNKADMAEALYDAGYRKQEKD